MWIFFYPPSPLKYYLYFEKHTSLEFYKRAIVFYVWFNRVFFFNVITNCKTFTKVCWLFLCMIYLFWPYTAVGKSIFHLFPLGQWKLSREMYRTSPGIWKWKFSGLHPQSAHIQALAWPQHNARGETVHCQNQCLRETSSRPVCSSRGAPPPMEGDTCAVCQTLVLPLGDLYLWKGQHAKERKRGAQDLCWCHQREDISGWSVLLHRVWSHGAAKWDH